MGTYKLTGYEQSGELVFEESFTATTDDEAKEKGREFLESKEWGEKTHRLASPLGKLLLFHS
ncbi:YhzD family protein [Chungangia koreensis]|uniref:YhzD family protein n=1 Tax=Chungangia koreensis TaxID=752657 RepID=A0ABV8X812_9LACT